jgi:hypothetical protein
MKRTPLLALVAVVLLFGAGASAQEEPPTKEVGFNYSLVHFIPAATGTQAHNINGGGGSFVYYPVKYFGLKVDLQGYASTTSTFVIPIGNSVVPNGGVFNVQGNLFTYMGGPIIRRQGKWEPYAQVLLGGAHSNVYGNLFTASQSLGAAPSNNAFALTAGVGLNIHLNRAIAIRPVEAGYLLTRFGNDFTGGGRNQNNFRYTAGVTYSF